MDGRAMNITLSAGVADRLEQELAAGGYQNASQLIEEAVQYFLEQRRRGQQRLEALRRLGQAVDAAGLYERVLAPDQG